MRVYLVGDSAFEFVGDAVDVARVEANKSGADVDVFAHDIDTGEAWVHWTVVAKGVAA